MNPTLILGWALDGAPAPVGLPPFTSATGRMGFLDLLGQWLGMTLQPEPETRRIAACHAAIAAWPQGFWSRSFIADPWATSRHVLAMRDALRLAGWDGTAATTTPRRIADLASLPALPPGIPDILTEIIATLLAHRPAFLPRIELVEPSELWPALWQKLFGLLRPASYPPPHPTAQGDLAALQNFIRTGQGAAWRGDGSLSLVTSNGTAPAANVISSCLSSLPPDCAFISGEAGLLGMMLCARQLPRPAPLEGPDLGAQLLALGVALLWAPFDAESALEFLALPQHPLGGACHYLADAISRHPGYGGAPYQHAKFSALRAKLKRDLAKGLDRPTRHRQARAQLEAIDAWLPPTRFTAEEGVPAATISALCNLVLRWATTRAMPEAGAAASALADAVTACGTQRFSPILLGRMLESTTTSTALLPAQATPWRHFSQESARIDKAPATIWWLGETGASSPKIWRGVELAWMEERNIQPDADLRRARARQGLIRAINLSGARIVIVSPRADAEEASTHPLHAELAGCFGETLPGRWVDAEALQSGGSLAGIVLPTMTLTATTPPAPRRNLHVPEGRILPRARESASGLETLLGCPLKWVLQYGVKLYARGPASLPDTDRLTGQFLHDIMQQVFENGFTGPNDAAAKAQTLFDQLLPEIAAPLLQPGMQAQLIRARMRIGQSMATLARQILAAGLAVAGVEQGFERQLPGIPSRLYGRTDLLLRRERDGLLVVLDAKWSRSASWHRKKLGSNTAVQLAAYAWLVGRSTRTTAAYFLLRQARLHAATPYPFADAAVPGADLPTTWDAALEDYRDALAELQAGKIIATGIPAEEDELPNPRLEIPPPCNFCDYQSLCGVGACQ